MAAKPFAIPGSSGVVGPTTTNNVLFHGFVVHETAGATAVARLRDSGAVGGLIVGEISLAANASADLYNADILCRGGLYFELVSGAIEGSVFVE